jgi:hypothetical protein
MLKCTVLCSSVESIHVDSTSRARSCSKTVVLHLINHRGDCAHAKKMALLFAWMSKWMKMRQTKQSRPRPTSSCSTTSRAVSSLPSHAACASAESGRERGFCSRRAETLRKVISTSVPWVSEASRVALVRTDDHFTRIESDILSTSAVHQSIRTLGYP